MVLSWHVKDNKINGNIISNTSLASIYLSDTAGTANYWRGAIISNNTILNSKQQGILFGARNLGVPITRNTIFNCTGYGIDFGTGSDDNEVRWNNFFHNNGGGTQAFDNGTNNVFEYNHWNDHISPDVDGDGFVDTDYAINGRGGLRLTGTPTSYMRKANPISTFATTAFTVELWVNPNETAGSIFSYASSHSDNEILFGLGSGTLYIYVGGFTTTASVAINNGEWIHLVITWQNSDGNTTLWINGILRFNGTLYQGSSLVTGGSLVLGQDQDSVGDTTSFNFAQAFNGSLDEVRILNRVLNQSEIQADYGADPYYPVRTGTIAWYHLDDTGITATDSAGGVGDGTVTGGEWVDGARTRRNNDSYPRIAPIWIDSNDDFLNFRSSGAGTANNPYIIENQHFMSNQTRLIEIRNTDAHFEIRNSTFDGLNGSNYLIYLDDVNNGRILNNTICNAVNNAIWIAGLSNNTKISGNTIYDCGSGIRLIGSGNSNIISENWIYNLKAEHATGITLDYGANSNTIVGNIIFGNWSYVNHVHGISVGQFANQNMFSGNTIYNCGYNGFYIATSSHHNTYSENTISDCGGNGIYSFLSAHNNTYSNNIISNTSKGIWLDNSSDNLIIRNSISDSSADGISLSSSNNNTLRLNVLSDCTSYGVNLVYSNNCLVTRNNFINNYASGTSQAYDKAYDFGSDNNISYNYWSTHTSPDSNGDGFVDPPYYLDPFNVANQDLHPRTTPVPSLIIVSPLTGTYGSSLITVTLDGTAPQYWYYIEGIDVQNQTWTVTMDRSIADGTHTLHFYSKDADGTITHESVTFTIDTTPPIITITSPTNTTYSQNSVTLTYTVSDGIFTLYIDGVDKTIASGSVVSALTDGSHNITIVAVDTMGNVGKTTVIFTVDPTFTTTPVDSTATGTVTTSISPSDTSKTTTTSKPGSFPGIFVILSFFTILVVFVHRYKRT